MTLSDKDLSIILTRLGWDTGLDFVRPGAVTALDELDLRKRLVEEARERGLTE